MENEKIIQVLKQSSSSSKPEKESKARLLKDLETDYRLNELTRAQYLQSVEGLADLSANVNSISSQVQALNNLSSTNSSGISSLQTSVNTHSTQIAANSTSIGTLQNSVSSIQTSVESANTAISTIQSQMTSVQANIDEMEDDVESANFSSNTAISSVGALNSRVTIAEGAIDYFQSVIDNFLVEKDAYKTGLSFSEYPAGTILKSYDVYERKFSFNQTTSTFTSPKVFFCAEPNSSGDIILHFDYTNTLNVFTMLVKIFLNDVEISSEVVDVSEINILKTYSKTLRGQALNTTYKGNNVYFSLGINSSYSSRAYLISRIKVEMFAPNADLINRANPYMVDTMYDEYIITDCTSGYGKYCRIDKSSIYNLDNLTFVDSSYQTDTMGFCRAANNYQTGWVPQNETMLIFHGGQNKVKMKLSNQTSTKEFNSFKIFDYDFFPKKASYPHYFACLDNGHTAIAYISLTNSCSCAESTNFSDAVLIRGAKYPFDICQMSYSSQIYAFINKNGEVTVCNETGGTWSINLGYGTNVRLYYTAPVTTQNNYQFEIYIKHFDKIIKKTLTFTSSGFAVTGDTTEVGIYEDYFKGYDNDYFVVKNGELKYHKYTEEN